MAALIAGSRGQNVERWAVSAAEYDGGQTVVIDTAIRPLAVKNGAILDPLVEMEFVKVDVYPNFRDSTAVGTPDLVKPVASIVGGVIRVTLANAAPPGNKVPCEVEIRRDHSVVR
jgi:hypothetical protein